jgi:hypothetical protein
MRIDSLDVMKSQQLLSSKYQKYTWICPSDCDALIEYTFKDGYGWPSGVTELTCRCGTACILLSVEDATIPYTDSPLPTKEEKMEEITSMHDLPLSDSEKYNPDLLVTYKVLSGYSDPTYATDKVRNIEWELHNSRTNSKAVSTLNNKIGTVKDIICEAYPDSDDQETLRAIAEALDIELTREIQWTASIEISGIMTVDLLEDVDVESELYDSLYADSHNGNIEIVDSEVCNAREC